MQKLLQNLDPFYQHGIVEIQCSKLRWPHQKHMNNYYEITIKVKELICINKGLNDTENGTHTIILINKYGIWNITPE